MQSSKFPLAVCFTYGNIYIWASQVALVIKNLPANAEDMKLRFNPGLGRSPGGGYGNPFQYTCLENPMNRGTQQATVHRATESNITETTQHACNMYVPMLRSQFVPPSPPAMSTSLVSMFASLLLPYKLVHQCHFSRLHISALIFSLSDLLHSV